MDGLLSLCWMKSCVRKEKEKDLLHMAMPVMLVTWYQQVKDTMLFIRTNHNRSLQELQVIKFYSS